MRFVLMAVVVLGGAMAGCKANRHPSGDSDFNDRHPEYGNRPSYFDKDPGYDTTDLNDRYPRSSN